VLQILKTLSKETIGSMLTGKKESRRKSPVLAVGIYRLSEEERMVYGPRERNGFGWLVSKSTNESLSNRLPELICRARARFCEPSRQECAKERPERERASRE